jgi:parvulin-like peptidyl-prolyl isomerase
MNYLRYLVNRLVLLFIILATLLGIAKVGWAEENMNDSTLAIVNGERITLDDLSKELRRIHSGQMEAHRSNYSMEKLINKLVNDHLMIQDAHLLELEQEPKFQKKIEAFQLKEAAKKLLQEMLPDTFSVNDDEVNHFFEEEFKQYRFAIVSVPNKELADSLILVVKHGGDIKKLAKQYSVDMYRYRGGDRGFVRWIDIENLIKNQADSIEVGQVRGPYVNHDVFSFFQLLDMKPANPEELAANKAEIISILKMRKRQMVLNQFLENLRKPYAISIDNNALESLKKSHKPSISLDDPGPILAKVGKAQITARDYYHKLMMRGMWSSEISLDTVIKGTIDELINDKLVELEAVKEGLLDEPEVVEDAKNYQDSLLVMTYIEQVVNPKINVTEAEIDSFYEANRENYRGASEVVINQITVADKSTADSLMTRLKAGADFGWLAKTYSTDDYADKSGYYGSVSTDVFPESIRKEVESCALGDILGPYRVEDGYMIFKISDRTPGKILELSSTAENIKQILYQQHFNQVLNETLESLRNASQITLNQKVIDHLAISGSP